MLTIALLPVVLICIYVYKKDRRKEPTLLILTLFLAGLVSCYLDIYVTDYLKIIFPGLYGDTTSMSFFQVFLHVFFGVALVEECCKFVMSYAFGYNNKHFDELYDIVLYCIVVSCGFAAFENILYVFSDQGGISLGILRGILSVPSHACDALFMGYYLSIAKFYSLKQNKKQELKYIGLSIAIPVLLHGVYDFLLLSRVFPMIIFYIFVIVIYVISIKKLNYISKNNRDLYYRTVAYCKHCGTPLVNGVCNKCQNKESGVI